MGWVGGGGRMGIWEGVGREAEIIGDYRDGGGGSPPTLLSMFTSAPAARSLPTSTSSSPSAATSSASLACSPPPQLIASMRGEEGSWGGDGACAKAK